MKEYTILYYNIPGSRAVYRTTVHDVNDLIEILNADSDDNWTFTIAENTGTRMTIEAR